MSHNPNALCREQLYSLEAYANQRVAFRNQVMAHKTNRRVSIGPHATLYFEDQLTIQYQIQEMLRIERLYTTAEIQEELDTYNPLIPNGKNWKATFMLEYTDEQQRHQELQQLVGIENQIWVQIGDLERVRPIADEDLTRTEQDKTSAVHFVRFELSTAMRQAAHQGATIQMGIDHPAYTYTLAPLPTNLQTALVADLEAN
jgi:hypothetical protein